MKDNGNYIHPKHKRDWLIIIIGSIVVLALMFLVAWCGPIIDSALS